LESNARNWNNINKKRCAHALCSCFKSTASVFVVTPIKQLFDKLNEADTDVIQQQT
jgi:hypothetical protein